MPDPKDPLDVLEEKIDRAEEDFDKREALEEEVQSSMPRGAHIGIEMVGSIFIPPLIGWKIDEWLGTKPLFFIGLFVLGVVAAFYSLFKLSQGYDSGVGFVKKKQKNVGDSPLNKK